MTSRHCAWLGPIITLALAVTLAGPAAARQPSRFRLDTTSAWGGAVNAFQRVGNYGFCGSGQRLVVLDMSNEAAIHEVACLHMQGTVEDIAIAGNYAYVGLEDFPNSFATVNISNPAAPVVTSVFTPPATF